MVDVHLRGELWDNDSADILRWWGWRDITAPMDIASRQDVEEFLAQLGEGTSTLLSSATAGYHYHLIEAATPARLDLIEERLAQAGLLAPLSAWEQ